jgi:hypothetical protein
MHEMEDVTLHSPARYFLLLAGCGTLCLAAVQAAMPVSQGLVRAFGGPVGWPAPIHFASSFAVAAVLMLLCLYCLSGAGVIRRLPCLLPVLATAGACFLARGLFLPVLAVGALGLGPGAGHASWAGLVVTTLAFELGFAYLVGAALLWRSPSRAPRGLVTP